MYLCFCGGLLPHEQGALPKWIALKWTQHSSNCWPKLPPQSCKEKRICILQRWIMPCMWGGVKLLLPEDQNSKLRCYFGLLELYTYVVFSVGSCQVHWALHHLKSQANREQMKIWQKKQQQWPHCSGSLIQKKASSLSVFNIQLSELVIIYLEECVALPTDRFK